MTAHRIIDSDVAFRPALGKLIAQNVRMAPKRKSWLTRALIDLATGLVLIGFFSVLIGVAAVIQGG